MPPDSQVARPLHRRLSRSRALLAIVFLATAYRHRGPFFARLRAFKRALQRAAHAANLLSLVLSQTSADVQHYLHPAPRGRGGAAAPVPRSLRRLLRLAATPDALAVLHKVAGGVAGAVTRELHSSAPRLAPVGTASEGPATGVTVEEKVIALMEALASPAGQAVVKNVVSTGAREVVAALAHEQERARDRQQKPWPEVLVEGLASDRGRRLVVDVAASITRTAVPLVVNGGGNTGVDSEPREVRLVPSILSPVATPMRRRRPGSGSTPTHSKGSSFIMPSGPVAAASGPVAGGESPLTKHLVRSVMQVEGNNGIMARLALLAIRDKGLVREVVRTVIHEAWRTYSNTQANTSKGGGTGKGAAGPSCSSQAKLSPGASCDMSGAAESTAQAAGGSNANGGTTSGTGRVSMWRMLIQSVVYDLKKALISRGSAEGNTGWLIF